MNEVLENIFSRRSCRSFSDRHVSDEDLNLILKAAIHAPSGMNKQSWQFTAVSNKELIKRLADTVAFVLDRPGYNMYNPDVIVIASNDVDNTNGLADCACAMENMFLAAHSLSIDSVWINQLKDICQTPNIRPILSEMDIPDNHNVWGIVALGYGDEPLKEINKNDAVIKIIK